MLISTTPGTFFSARPTSIAQLAHARPRIAKVARSVDGLRGRARGRGSWAFAPGRVQAMQSLSGLRVLPATPPGGGKDNNSPGPIRHPLRGKSGGADGESFSRTVRDGDPRGPAGGDPRSGRGRGLGQATGAGGVWGPR